MSNWIRNERKNIRKYDENKIHRRQYKNWKVSKNLQKFDTSKTKKFVREKLNVNFLIIVAMQYRVDKKICWKTNIFEKLFNKFNLTEIKR